MHYTKIYFFGLELRKFIANLSTLTMNFKEDLINIKLKRL